MNSNSRAKISEKNFSQDSDKIYLHFLDREACFLSNSYSLPESVFLEVFDVIACMTYETFILSGGHLFEHKAAKSIFNAYSELFYKRQILPVSAQEDIFDFVSVKRDQYRFSEHSPHRDYSIYFSDDWQEMFDRPFTFQSSSADTGRMLHAELMQRRIFKGDLDKRVRGTLEDREGRAITEELFRSTGQFNPSEIRQISRHISHAYTGIYSQLYANHIFKNTGLVSQVVEHGVGRTYDFILYERIYRLLGLDRLVFAQRNEFAEFRRSSDHVRFIQTLRTVADKVDTDPDLHVPNLVEKLAKMHGYDSAAPLRRYEIFGQMSDALSELTEMPIKALVEYASSRKTVVYQKSGSAGPKDKREIGLLDVIIPIAAQQELSFARRRLADRAIGVHRNQEFGGLRFDVFELENERGDIKKCGMVLARGQGKAAMTQLLNDIATNTPATMVIMVGMMAAIKGKARLLDVAIPGLVYDAVAQGVRDGSIIGEPEAYPMDPRLHHVASSIEWGDYFSRDHKVICHKKTVCVAAKFDDISHELAQSAVKIDPENIIGIEMEGAALGQFQAGQRLAQARDIAFLMIKGTADYAGEKISDDELGRLQSILGNSTDRLSSDPTGDGQMKSLLQSHATSLALDAAIALIKTY